MCDILSVPQKRFAFSNILHIAGAHLGQLATCTSVSSPRYLTIPFQSRGRCSSRGYTRARTPEAADCSASCLVHQPAHDLPNVPYCIHT